MFDESSQQRLSQLLDPKAETGATMRCDEVQAYMLALLTGPDELNTGEWLPEVMGGEHLFTPVEEQEIESLVLEMVLDMRMKLDGRMLPDLWLYDDEAGNPDFHTWCNAYLYALDVVPTDWFEAANDEEFEDLFYPIMALGGIYDEDENGEMVLHLTARELTQLESELPHVLLDIYYYWQSVKNKPQTVRREGAKIGRNDPCPCGSGKKYKTCCGKEQAV